ncbi:MAG: response regulator, partial [Pseudomonadota bacterium]
NDVQEVMGTQRAAEALGVSVRTVQLWVENGTLKAWKTPGKHRRILRSSVEAVIAGREGNTPAEPVAYAHDVLIVEDEPAMQAYYEAMFELVRPQLKLRFAGNGFEGLVEYGRKEPGLMLLDIDMPLMDGVALIKALDNNGRANVRIVVVTSLTTEQIEKRGGVRKGIPVISKPVSVEALNYILDECFGEADGEPS